MKKDSHHQHISKKGETTYVAFVHDRLYHLGGAEAVFLELISKRFDKDEKNGIRGKIFTLFSDTKLIWVDGKELEIVTALPAWIFAIFSWFEKHRVPLLSKLFDYRNLMFFYPILVRILRAKVISYAPDEMIVSSFAAVKNIVPIRRTYRKLKETRRIIEDHKALGSIQTTLYLHSPMQYIRDYYEDNVRKLSFPIKQLYQLITPVLRRWDKTPRHYDTIYYNSNYTKTCAHRLYGRDYGEVNYPPINPQYLHYQLPSVTDRDSQSDYYIFVGRLVRFAKELDLIIRLFNTTGDKLIIMGSGPDEEYVKSIAGPTIEFVGRVSDVAEKIQLVGGSLGLINLTRESFGMVTVEALSLGVPVFGYNQGGSVELVNEQSGILISDKQLDHVIEQWEIFKTKDWDRQKIGERMKMKLNNSF